MSENYKGSFGKLPVRVIKKGTDLQPKVEIKKPTQVQEKRKLEANVHSWVAEHRVAKEIELEKAKKSFSPENNQEVNLELNRIPEKPEEYQHGMDHR